MPSMTSTSTAASRRRPGWYIPWLFLPPFMAVLLANICLIYFAFASFSGLTTEHASAEGANYNAAITASRAQAERGWQGSVTFSNPEKLVGTVDLILLDREHRPLTRADVTATFIRPTSTGADQAFQLRELDGGHYRAEVMLKLPGIWELRLVARHPAGTWQNAERVMVK
ncbi:MAG: FixH family protein [Rhodospirillaceae bacterium]